MTLDELKAHPVYIVGTGKYQKDFEYIFDQLRVCAYVTDDDAGGLPSGRKQLSMDGFCKEQLKENSIIIICEKPDDGKKAVLTAKRKDIADRIYYAEELFPLLDDELSADYWVKGRKIAFLGTFHAEALLERGIVPEIVITNTGEKVIQETLEILKNRVSNLKITENIPSEKNLYFIIAMTEWDRGVMLLDRAGYTVRNDYMDGTFFLQVKYSQMLKHTIEAKSYAQRDCCLPFYNWIIAGEMRPYPCCPAGIIPKWRDEHKAYFFSPEELWNSMWFKLMRLSVVNKTYCFCDWHFCNRLRFDIPETTERMENVKLYKTPTDLQVEFDYTCNLHCPSCRPGVRVATPWRKHILDKIVPMFKNEIMDNLEWTRLAGYGDVFASPYYQDLLYTDKKRKNLFLITNANLLTEEKFDPLPDMYEKIELYVSIDAATEETYNKLRPGGNWSRLMNNLEMLSKKHKDGKIAMFRIQFVVQMANYMEMPAYVEFGRKLGVTDVYFNSIRNWGFYSDEEFAKLSILNPDYSIKNEVLPYVNHEIIKQAPDGFVVIDFVK